MTVNGWNPTIYGDDRGMVYHCYTHIMKYYTFNSLNRYLQMFAEYQPPSAAVVSEFVPKRGALSDAAGPTSSAVQQQESLGGLWGIPMAPHIDLENGHP